MKLIHEILCIFYNAFIKRNAQYCVNQLQQVSLDIVRLCCDVLVTLVFLRTVLGNTGQVGCSVTSLEMGSCLAAYPPGKS